MHVEMFGVSIGGNRCSQKDGILYLEKAADKWDKNEKDEECQEQWSERYDGAGKSGYDGAGKSEKWAQKWCSIDPITPLEASHAHIWIERWGEKYDGHGGSTKYTEKCLRVMVG